MTVTRRKTVRTAGAALLAALAAAGLARAQQAVPADLQAPILARMLAYDRSLKARAGASVGIGIVYKASDKVSTDMHGEIRRAFKSLEAQTIQGLSLVVSVHPYKDAATLAEWIAGDGIDAVYVTPGLAAELDAIRGVCRDRRVASMSAMRSFVEQGIAVGVVVKGDTPRILVNLPAAESMGMDLDSKLLQLSEVIR